MAGRRRMDGGRRGNGRRGEGLCFAEREGGKVGKWVKWDRWARGALHKRGGIEAKLLHNLPDQQEEQGY